MKNKKHPTIVGLDIGTTKVMAIAGRKNEAGKLEILGIGQAESVGVINGSVLNIDQCMHSIQQAIENCGASNADLDIKDVYVGISGQHLKTIQTRGQRVRKNADEEISTKDIDMLRSDQYKTLIPESDHVIDIIPHNFVVDGRRCSLTPIGMTGTRVEANFHIITGDRSAIKNTQRSVHKTGLNIKDMFVQPIAVSEMLVNEEDKEAGVAIVDIGGGTTDITVYYDGALTHTAVIPLGGNNITNDIRVGLGLLRSQAEQLKVIYGVASSVGMDPGASITVPGARGLQSREISLKSLAVIIEEAMQEIIDYVVYHLKQLNLDKSLNGGIILTGGGAQLKNIKKLAEQMTGMQVRIGNVKEHIADEQADATLHPGYLTCISLIMKAYSDLENAGMLFVSECGNIKTVNDVAQTDNEPAKPDYAAPKSNNDIPLHNRDVVYTPDLSERREVLMPKKEKQSKKLAHYAVVLRERFMGLFEEIEEVEMV